MSVSYTIPLSGLKEGRHIIDFEIGKEFFEQFEESEVKEGSLIANIEMDKRSSHPDDKNGNSTCDPVMLKKLKELIVEEENESDPSWDELKKLINDN
ncbi:MAG: hypothetical protein Q7J06_05315 [Bacteroidales bacterium]|nr:hypothetical protein [Bacteroidales bacterium]